MKIISFGWTHPAVTAGHKTCTRRAWKQEYASRFRAGDIVLAYDRSPRIGGKPIAKIRLTEAPYKEPMCDMPNSDYEAEGLAWLAEHSDQVPPSARKQVWGDCTFQAFYNWRWSGGSVYVVRFEVVEVLV